MRDQHIASAYDRDLETIQAMLAKMGGLVEEAITSAAEALEMRDDDLAETVRRGDAAVDRLEEDVQEECARVIAIRAPVGRDLRTVLTVLKIAGNLERIGDYAKNLAKRTTVLSQMQPVGDSAAGLRRMSRQVREMLKDALDAYIQRDAGLAADVRLRDRDVDQMYNALFRQFITHMMEDPRNITACMHLHFIAKNVERMGDHVTSIADETIYLVTGTRPEDERPKADRTSIDRFTPEAGA